MSRILIVDDEPANARLLGEALRDQHQLFVATDGARAIEIAGRGDIDLVLLDVAMPGMDGFEVCRRLKREDRTRSIPVIFVTAMGEVDGETRGFDEGGVDYITKPISPPVVRARVKTHLELKEARDMLERLASIDPLTGIANRRRLEAVLDQEWRRAVRHRHGITVAIADVDHFKKYNDRYGHARGDAVLRTVARAAANVCRRPGDLAARFGGEEFVLVLSGAAPVVAAAILREFLGAVETLGIEHCDSPDAPILSLSLGAASIMPSDGGSPESLLARADELLYEAKAKGRRQGFHLDLSTGAKSHLVIVSESMGEEP